MTQPAPETALRALDLFERLLAYPGNVRFRTRLLKRESEAVLAELARIEAGHGARAAMPTILPDAIAAPALAPPQRIGPFRLTERIALGGMGDVWRGERDDGLFEQIVAVKLIQSHLSESAAAAFEAERRILAKLDHPDIVRLTDGGVTDTGLPYLIMDYVEGVPFDQAVAILPLDQRIRLFIQAANTVQFAHSRLVAHADLKPSNIMVDQEGRVRLLDFGISGLLTGDATAPSGAMTREYASPQRIAGAPPSIADDVYALGRMLGVITAPPFGLSLAKPSDDPSNPFDKPRANGVTANGGLGDADLAAITAKATAHEEANRYDTVAALIADLGKWQDGLPVSAHRDSFAYRTHKFIARHRLGVAASVLAILALLGTTIYAVASANRAERARAEAAARYDDARGTARYLLFTLMDRLEAQPNSLALRGEVARVAQHYLDRLSRAEGASPEVRIEAARGLIRLAEAQGVPGLPNLANPEGAKRSLDRALAILGSKPKDEAATAAVTALVYRARIMSWVDNAADAALVTLAQAAAIIAAHPHIPAHLKARVLNERAAALGWKNDYPGAIKETQQTLALLPNSNRLDILTERAKSADMFAEATYYAASPQAAIKPYRDAVTIHETATRLYPKSRVMMQRLAHARWALGSTLLANKQVEEALALLEATSADLQKMVAFDGDDQEAARQLQIVELDRATALADAGKLDEGIALLRTNIVERKAWLARHPAEPRKLRDLAISVKALGDMQANHGRSAAGCESYAEFKRYVAQMERLGNFAEMDMAYTMDDLGKMEAKHCRYSGPKTVPFRHRKK